LFFFNHIITEKEISLIKSELLKVTGERESLREDLREVKEAKRRADQSFREQAARTEALERELVFYRQQAAQAIADRDSTAWDCERLRLLNTELADKSKNAENKADASMVERVTAERRLEEAEATISDLRKTAAAAEAIPELRADLSKAEGSVRELQISLKNLEKELHAEKNAREVAEKCSKTSASALDAKNKELEETRLADADAIAMRQRELADVTQQKVDALMRLSDAQAARSRADQEVNRLQMALTLVQEQLGQATAEKVQALMLVAELRASTEGTAGPNIPMNSTPNSSPSKSSPAKSPEKRGWLGTTPPTTASPARHAASG